MARNLSKGLIAGGITVGLVLTGGVATASTLNVAEVNDSADANSLLVKTDPSGVAPTDENNELAKNATQQVRKASDPRAAFVKLSKTDRERFKAYNFTVRTVEDNGQAVPLDEAARASVAANPASAMAVTASVVTHASVVHAGVPANGCWSVPGGLTGTNAFGASMWRISHVHQLCVTNGKVTKATFQSTSGQATFAGWRWVKLDGKATGVVNGQSRQYVQHKFALGINGWDIQVVDPCSRSAGTASGNVIPSTACNINLG